MDFKVAGDAEGVTAFQCVLLHLTFATADLFLRRMDIKCEGITATILREALEAARVGRIHILGRMSEASPPPRCAMAPHAPRIGRTQIDPSKAGLVIGPGGAGIRRICESTGASEIHITDKGEVTITAPSQAMLDAAMAVVQGTTAELVVGSIYRGVKVTSLTDFGAFVEVMPGKTGLLHISELAITRVTRVSDEVKPGDAVDVQLLECVQRRTLPAIHCGSLPIPAPDPFFRLNSRGQMRLSRRAVLEADLAALSA
jgi:polyribonucleotide nucleotidyltransferase